MFSNIGWFEVIFIILVGIVIIGPERLPGVILDIRAAIFAARRAINNAKAELTGEFGEFSEEFEQFRQPISQAAEWGRMGPRAALTKALFDGDDSALDAFDPKKMLAEDLGDGPALTDDPQPQARDYPSHQTSRATNPGNDGGNAKPPAGGEAPAGGWSWTDLV